MKTITLFSAYTIASAQSHEACVRIAGECLYMPAAELFSLVKFAARRESQRVMLERAVRARLAAQCQNADYADDLADDDDSATGQVLEALKG